MDPVLKTGGTWKTVCGSRPAAFLHFSKKGNTMTVKIKYQVTFFTGLDNFMIITDDINEIADILVLGNNYSVVKMEPISAETVMEFFNGNWVCKV